MKDNYILFDFSRRKTSEKHFFTTLYFCHKEPTKQDIRINIKKLACPIKKNR